MNIDTTLLLISFCGGAFGAAIGALPAFIFCGFLGFVGVAAAMSGSTFDWHSIITFGPFFGPHIAFAGGVAATAFAKKMGYMVSGKDITAGLMGLKQPGVLVVGGIFGMVGYVTQVAAAAIFNQGQFDTVAFTVVFTALIAKAVFGDGFLGRLTPEAQARGRFAFGGDQRWLPFMESMAEKIIIGVAAGGLSAFVTSTMLADPATASSAPFVGFLVSAASLVFLQYGTSVPVTHHITLCAAYGTLFSGGNILWGVTMGIVGALLADLGARLFLIHGDTHIDPPAFGIFTGSLVAYALGIMGLYEMGNVPPIIILAAAVVWGVWDWNKSRAGSVVKAKEIPA